MRAVIFDTQTGVILRQVMGNLRAIQAQCGTGEAYKEGEADATTQMVRLSDGAFVARILSDEERAQRREIAFGLLRVQRDQLLNNCDWVLGADSPLSAAQKQSWRSYRQALRDLPTTTDDPENPDWPDAPERQA